MENSEKIIGERVYLRKLSLTDVSPSYCGWLNNEEVNKYIGTKSCTMTELKNYVLQKFNNPDCLFMGIFDKKSNLHIGTVKLEPIDWRKKEARFGLLIGNKNYWGKGIGVEATRLVVDYAFSKMGLNRIIVSAYLENKPAVKVYEKSGFKVDEIKKGDKRLGKLFDQLAMSIITMSINKNDKK